MRTTQLIITALLIAMGALTVVHAQVSEDLLVVVHPLTDAEMQALTPATGALAFNTDEMITYTYNGSEWIPLEQRVRLVDNNDGSFTFSNGVDPDVTFTPGGGASVPIVSQSDATGGCANQFQVNETRDVIIQGDYFDGSSTVTISGQTVNSVTVNSATQITANVTAGSTTGDYDIQVTTTGGTGTLPNGFSIKAALTTYNYNSGDITLGSQMSYNSGVLTRTAGSGWNQHGYSTLYGIPSGKEGRLNFTVGSNTRYRMVGLNSDPATNASYTSIDYAIYVAANRYVYVYENGSYKGRFGTYANGDDFEVNVNCDGTVTYLKNGSVFYTSTVTASNTLYLDSSFYQSLTDISNISITY